MDNLVIRGKNYISSKRAAEVMGYTQDYIGQLARAGKISAERVSGVWYISEDEFSGVPKDKTHAKEISTDSVSNLNKDDITNKFNTQNKSDVALNGEGYVSSKEAAKIMGYSQDYIGQLCRNGKIKARQIGRGWYIPKSVVNMGTHKTPKDNKQETTQTEMSKVTAFEDIVTFKKEKEDEIPIKLKGFKETGREVTQEEKQPEKEAITGDVKITENIKLEDKLEEKHKENSEKEYFYPSFLSASYSFDNTPLVPTPKRSREPVLHKIVTDEKKDTLTNNIPIRHTSTHSVETPQKQIFNVPIREPRRVQRITSDILKPKNTEEHSLALRSPLSLMKMASFGVAIALFASIVSFVPNISVFSSNTGVLKNIYSLRMPQNNILRAEVVTSTSKTTVLETLVKVFSSLLEDTIEYKAK